jgi:hypothetical protein
VPNDAQLPLDVVHDLLAICRALYVHSSKLGAPFAAETLKLRGIGAQLTLALQRAQEGTPGTYKHKAAWLIAEQALADLAPLMGELRGSVLLDVLSERLAAKKR